MTQLHFGVKQLKIDRTMGVLYSFGWNHVKYANMEGFCRDSHIYHMTQNSSNKKFWRIAPWQEKLADWLFSTVNQLRQSASG